MDTLPQIDQDFQDEIGDIYSLEEAFANVKNEVKIVKQPNAKEYGPYTFQVQEPQCAIFQGKVNYNMSLKIKDMEGKPLIKIKPYVAFQPNGQQFSVNHGTKPLAILTLNPLTNTLVITSSDGTYTVQKMENDLSISKLDSTTITLARIHIPAPSADSNVQPFECFLTFRTLTTAVEKSLFISLAATYMMVRNGPVLAKERRSAFSLICCFNVCVVLLYFLVMVLIVVKGVGVTGHQ